MGTQKNLSPVWLSDSTESSNQNHLFLEFEKILQLIPLISGGREAAKHAGVKRSASATYWQRDPWWDREKTVSIVMHYSNKRKFLDVSPRAWNVFIDHILKGSKF